MEAVTLRSGTGPAIEWAVASQPTPGESVCGDVEHVVALGDEALLAVTDGLGHGPDAAVAARAATAAVDRAAVLDPAELVASCHHALRPTRGAVMSLVRLRDGDMTWVGVGNVAGLLACTTGERRYLSAAPGILGLRVPSIRPQTIALRPGDTIVLATDGIRAGFADSIRPGRTPAANARDVIAEHRKPHDDALVLVAVYLGDNR